METAVVLPVPAAEAVVGGFRRAHTPSGANGMPAHVTLLSPFVQSVTDSTVGSLAAALSGFERFELVFPRLARFDGPPQVLYAAPDPAQPFIEITEALSRRFAIQPYNGLHGAVIPHLTVATRVDDPTFAAIEAQVSAQLPIRTAAEVVQVWEYRAEGWRQAAEVPLA